ncbi:MAG: hypothetical protein KIT40_14795 [Nitrospira sp.]|nr:hypothetical protein [Nitrospira sp.]
MLRPKDHGIEAVDPNESLAIPIKPIYEMSAINEAVSLHAGELEIEQSGQVFAGTGTMSLRWLPTPGLRFSVSLRNDGPSLTLGQARLRYCHSPVSFDAFISLMIPGMDGIGALVEASGWFSFAFGGQGSGLCRCIFHVPNFIQYLGKPVTVSNRHFYRGQAVMECNEWRITLQRLQCADNKYHETLKSLGGYAFTHVGEMARKDGGTFRLNDLKDHLEKIRWWLSFCRGFWVAPLLPIGMGSDNTRRWWDWQDSKIDQTQTVMTWANPYSESFLEDTYTGFMERITRNEWKEPTELSIWWYLASNTRAGGMEGSIILTQSAFELLAWTLFVEEHKTLNAKSFKRLSGAEKIRRLLTAAGIPLPIPDCLHSLCNMAVKHTWHDGPQTLTQFRNGFTHPERKQRQVVVKAEGLALFEAWSLGLWYLELLLLWLFDFKGLYVNRLRREIPRSDAVERVPWRVE